MFVTLLGTRESIARPNHQELAAIHREQINPASVVAVVRATDESALLVTDADRTMHVALSGGALEPFLQSLGGRFERTLFDVARSRSLRGRTVALDVFTGHAVAWVRTPGVSRGLYLESDVSEDERRQLRTLYPPRVPGKSGPHLVEVLEGAQSALS